MQVLLFLSYKQRENVYSISTEMSVVTTEVTARI